MLPWRTVQNNPYTKRAYHQLNSYSTLNHACVKWCIMMLPRDKEASPCSGDDNPSTLLQQRTKERQTMVISATKFPSPSPSDSPSPSPLPIVKTPLFTFEFIVAGKKLTGTPQAYLAPFTVSDLSFTSSAVLSYLHTKKVSKGRKTIRIAS